MLRQTAAARACRSASTRTATGSSPSRSTGPDARRAVHGPDGRGPSSDGRSTARDRLDRRPQPPGQGPRRAPLGHPPGSPRDRAAPGRAATREEANAVLATYLPRHNAASRCPRPTPSRPGGPCRPTARPSRSSASPMPAGWPATRPSPGAAPGCPAPAPGWRTGRRSVLLEERLDGSLWVSHGGEHHRLAEAPPDPRVLRARDLSRSAEGQARPAGPRSRTPPGGPPGESRQPTSRRPGPDHPWRTRR